MFLFLTVSYTFQPLHAHNNYLVLNVILIDSARRAGKINGMMV